MSSVKQKRCKAIAAELPDGYRVAPWRLGGYAVHEARRLVRLVKTLGIDWPTDADLETAPEGGEA